MNQEPSTSSPPPAAPVTNWRDLRIAPHWSLLTAALIIFAFLLYEVRDQISPLLLCVAILALLYPSRRIRAIKEFLVLVLIGLLVLFWVRFSSLLWPFVVSFILAYAFDPFITWCSRRGIPRMTAVLGLVIGLLGLVVLALYLVVPAMVNEIATLATAGPTFLTDARQWFLQVVLPWLVKVNIPTDEIWAQLQPRLPGMVKTLISGFSNWTAGALTGALSFIVGLANLILIPFVTIYLLDDFPRIRRWVYQQFPDKFKEDVFRGYLGINEAISAFIRGQLLVCLFLAIWIGLGLLFIAKVPYALLLGSVAGLLNLIPYVGTTSALIVTVGVAMFQDDPIMTTLKALIVFVSAQTLEGNYITPKIVGDKVGLHPVAIMFAVLFFASLFGVPGMLVAIPVTAIGKVVLQVWIDRVRRNEALPRG